jgi:transposase
MSGRERGSLVPGAPPQIRPAKVEQYAHGVRGVNCCGANGIVEGAVPDRIAEASAFFRRLRQRILSAAHAALLQV